MRGRDIAQLCHQRQWSRSRLIAEMRSVTRARDLGRLPDDESLSRMIRLWANGSRNLSDFYAQVLGAVFGVPFEVGAPPPPNPQDQAAVELADELLGRLDRARSMIDADTVALLDQQTDLLRILDRRLGAEDLLAQSQAHVDQLSGLLRHALPSGIRTGLAAATAEAAALAGWQALDLGEPDRAWLLHEVARAAAQEGGDAAVLAHVTAQQAYVLLDLDRPADAVHIIRHARTRLRHEGPTTVRAWVWAAEAEALAAAGDEPTSRHALERAAELVAASDGEPLPYLFLDTVHLARWRGHCLARLGSVEAIDDLSTALDRLDPSFARARAGLHVDLALAHATAGHQDAARLEIAAATKLADSTSSKRQRTRLRKLIQQQEQAH